MKPYSIAFVYDRINKFGGAERVLMALHDIWPDAPLFTAVYDEKRAKWANIFSVHPSLLQRFPYAKNHHELFPWLTPMAFESFSFDKYDIVISITSAEAKNILTKPQTLHICYCLTPTRYLWSGYDTYQSNPEIGLPKPVISKVIQFITPTLRRWDITASNRPDVYIAISNLVARRIKLYYHKAAIRVIYPPVDSTLFVPKYHKNKSRYTYFLTVSRLVGYKHTDIIINAFNKLGLPLVVIGDGWEKSRLKRSAHNNIFFIDNLTDKQLVSYYQNCRAFIYAGEEDFGIVAAEAQLCGKPVIAYKNSGIAEIVIPGKTGILFDKQTEDALITALNTFAHQWYDSSLCRKNGERFSKQQFQKKMKEAVEYIYLKHI